MKLPIYSHIKAKLESKGLDSITSGQLAWFACSVGIFIPPMLYFYFTNNNQNVILVYMLFIFVFNFFYIKNILPLLLVVFFIILFFSFVNYFDSAIWVVLGVLFLCVVGVCVIAKQWRLLVTFCVGIIHIVSTCQLFQILGGLIKWNTM